MELILQVFYSIFSGALLALAIPNELHLLGAPFYTLIAFIPYYLVFNKIKNYKQAFLCGFCQALTTHLISSFWLAYFKDFAALTLGASAFGTACIGGIFGLYLYLPYSDTKSHNKLNEESLYINFTKTSSFRIFYFTALYTIYEWVKSSGFLGYPWGTVSSAMFNWPHLRQLASITGTYGITFIILLFNAIAAEVYIHYVLRSQKRDYSRYFYTSLSALIFLIFALLIYLHGLYQYDRERKPQKLLTTIMVQQNSNPWDQRTDTPSILLSQELTLKQIEQLKDEGKAPDLIVWSEGCLKYPFPDSEAYYANMPSRKPLVDFIKETQTPFVLGGSFVLDQENQKYNNAALLFDKDGRFRGYYAKNHLVPFAEALPFIEYPQIKEIMQKIVGISAGWTPGDQYVYFEVPCKTTPYYKLPAVKNIDLNIPYQLQKDNEKTPVTVKLTAPICFDDSFTDIMRPMFLNGAELFVNITDDSWSLKKSSEYQHFVIA
ncbi:MAG: apolipoprotein N-acyltransferase, partial [Treponema sp.]|nr:apolipoprotein N-acyltransferase [Treponema sp.]